MHVVQPCAGPVVRTAGSKCVSLREPQVNNHDLLHNFRLRRRAMQFSVLRTSTDSSKSNQFLTVCERTYRGTSIRGNKKRTQFVLPNIRKATRITQFCNNRSIQSNRWPIVRHRTPLVKDEAQRNRF